MPDIIYAKDLQSRFIMGNVALARLMGVPAVEDLLGKTDLDFMPSELVLHYLEDDQRVFETGTPLVNREELNIGVNGVERWGSTNKVPIYDSNGNVCGLVGITRDVTEKKRASELLAQTNAALHSANEQLKAAQYQLIQFEKAQSLSRLAAGLAHEIKNPLAILEMGLSFITDEITEESSKTVLESMHEAVFRANRVIADVMQLAESHILDLHKQSLTATLNEVLLDLKPALESAHVELNLALDENLPAVSLDRSQFKQLLTHVLTNARQAMPRGGKLTVRTALQKLTPEDVAHDSGNRSGIRFRAGDETVIIEIGDTGDGIPEQNRSAIFDAFFTTKPTGTAVGLGLTVSRKIMELHGGTIEIGIMEPHGTRVTLRLKA